MLFSIARIAAGFAAVVLASQATAAEIKVYSTIGVKSALDDLIPKFEQATGHKLNFTWSTADLLTKRVQAGEMADVMILARRNVETLVKDGKIAPGSETTLPKSIIAVAIKQGAPKPDISTPEAFKNALLAAKGISYTNPAAGGASGVYMMKQIEKMGIAAQLKDKTKFPPAGGFAGNLLVSGDVDIAVQTTPEFSSVQGIEVIGPLPGDMAFTAAFMAGVGSGATQPEGGKAFLKFLTSPEALSVFKAKGFITS